MRKQVVSDFLDRLQFSNVPGRMFLFFLTMHTGTLAYYDSTMIGRVYDGAEYFGGFAIGIATLGMIDTFINDIMPLKYHFSMALATRHFTLMLSACFFAVGAFLATTTEGAYPLIPFFVACSSVITMHAFFDIRRRFKA